jgi:hypothetical protein
MSSSPEVLVYEVWETVFISSPTRGFPRQVSTHDSLEEANAEAEQVCGEKAGYFKDGCFWHHHNNDGVADDYSGRTVEVKRVNAKS